MTTKTQPETDAPWWRTAPNPPCEPWCTTTHPAGDFANGGGMLCRHVILDAPGVHVEVERTKSAVTLPGVPDGQVAADPAHIRHAGDERPEFLSADQAQTLGAAMLAAAAFLRAVQS